MCVAHGWGFQFMDTFMCLRSQMVIFSMISLILSNSLRFPFSVPWSEIGGFAHPQISAVYLPQPHSPMWLGRRRKTVNARPVWWYTKFWSSCPIFLLLFSLQSLPIASHRFSLVFVAAFHWERQGGVRSLHLTWNMNTITCLRVYSWICP